MLLALLMLVLESSCSAGLLLALLRRAAIQVRRTVQPRIAIWTTSTRPCTVTCALLVESREVVVGERLRPTGTTSASP